MKMPSRDERRSAMSKETEKLFKEFHKYIDEHSDENRTEADVERVMNEFIAQYNSSTPVYITPETAESADDYLELAYNATSMKDALKYAKEALKLDPHNFDAEALVLELKAKDGTKLVRDYAKAVQRATAFMEETGYFEDEYIGDFWGVLATRPYMRLRCKYANLLTENGMIGQARDECIELLRLCEGDNMGIRFLLMHIYAYFEDEEAALTLHKQFDSYDETEMLLPLSILYYKKGDFTKATQYLRKLNGANRDLKRFLKIVLAEGNEEFEGFELDGGYRPGTVEEFMVEFRDNGFLFMGMDTYFEWALQQTKKFK